MGVGRGGLNPLDFETFGKKVVFLVLSQKNKFHYFWTPQEKF